MNETHRFSCVFFFLLHKKVPFGECILAFHRGNFSDSLTEEKQASNIYFIFIQKFETNQWMCTEIRLDGSSNLWVGEVGKYLWFELRNYQLMGI